jgi:hypothetical protein
MFSGSPVQSVALGNNHKGLAPVWTRLHVAEMLGNIICTGLDLNLCLRTYAYVCGVLTERGADHGAREAG